MQLRIVPREPGAPIGHEAAITRWTERPAQIGSSTEAHPASAALRTIQRYDVIAHAEISYVGAEFYNPSCALVAEHGGIDTAGIAVFDRCQVGVTQAGRGDFHEHLTRTRRRYMDRVEPKWLIGCGTDRCRACDHSPNLPIG